MYNQEYDSEFVTKWINFIRYRITELRINIGLSEHQLSRRLGRAKSYIHGIVSGRTNASMSAFFEICEELNVDPVTFFATEYHSHTALRILEVCDKLNEKDQELVYLVVQRLVDNN